MKRHGAGVVSAVCLVVGIGVMSPAGAVDNVKTAEILSTETVGDYRVEYTAAINKVGLPSEPVSLVGGSCGVRSIEEPPPPDPGLHVSCWFVDSSGDEWCLCTGARANDHDNRYWVTPVPGGVATFCMQAHIEPPAGPWAWGPERCRPM